MTKYKKRPKIQHKCYSCSKLFFGTKAARFCNSCRNIRAKVQRKQYLIENKEKHKEQCKKWIINNKEKYLENIRKRDSLKRQNNQDYRKKINQRCRDNYKRNRDKRLEYRRNYQIQHREEINIWASEYRRQNPDRIAASNLKIRTREPIDSNLIKLVFKVFDYECMYCGKKEKLSLEHIIPVSKSGPNNFENLGVSCKSCNSTKKNKNQLEFMEYREKLRLAKLAK